MSNELQATDKQEVAVAPEQSVEHDAIALMESQIRYLELALPRAIAQTKASDWVDHGSGDNMYLQARGAFKVNRMFRISIDSDISIEEKVIKFRGEDKTIYVFRSKGTMPEIITKGGTIESYSFPCKAIYNPEDDNVYMNTAADLYKKAETQLLRDAIVRLVGLEGYSKSDLEVFFGAGSIKTMDRVQGSQGGKTAAQELTPELKEKRKELGEYLMDVVNGDKEEGARVLVAMTTWTNKEGKVIKGKDSLAKLSAKQIPVVLRKLKEEFPLPETPATPEGGRDDNPDDIPEY